MHDVKELSMMFGAKSAGRFEYIAWLLSYSKMVALFFDFCATLDEDFIWFESALEAEILASDQSLYYLSVGEKKKSAYF